MRTLDAYPRINIADPVPPTIAAIILGIGLGGFIDGIVLHQLLQWHEMLSAKIPNTNYIGKSVNMFWDGIFHLFCLLVTMIGIVKLWRWPESGQLNYSYRLFIGGLLMGWATFNLVEGLINHHIFKLHHVIERDANQSNADAYFLAGSFMLCLVGLWLVNSVKPAWQNRQSTSDEVSRF